MDQQHKREGWPSRTAATMKRRDLLALLSTACFVLPLPVRAQQLAQIRRLGVLLNLSENDQEAQRLVTVFRDELTRLGWVDGRNLRVDYRWTAGDVDRARAFAKELVELSRDIIVGYATPSAVALQRKTHSIPIESPQGRNRHTAPFAEPRAGALLRVERSHAFDATGVAAHQSVTRSRYQTRSTSAPAFSRASFGLRRPSAGRTSLQFRKGFECDGVWTIALPHWIIWAVRQVFLAHALLVATRARPLQIPHDTLGCLVDVGFRYA